MMKEGLLIYGCYGYTGKLISEHAVKSGLKPTLAGRDEKRVIELAEKLQLPYVCFDLNEVDVVAEKLSPFKVVIHCAGPFIHTSRIMVDACIKAKTHYLDITGEYQVFEEIYKKDFKAENAGILLMPGVGFDVVPSDCLAFYLKQQYPMADTLELALYQKGGRLSHGTAITIAENLGESCMIRKDGVLKAVPNGELTRKVVFETDPVVTVAIAWGDIVSAFRSTKIPNITVYNAVPPKLIKKMKQSNRWGFIFRWRWVKNLIIRGIKKRPAGPTEQERETAKTYIWGRVTNSLGLKKTAILKLPEGYTLTYLTAVRIAQLVLDGKVPVGAKTPAQVFGADFILQFEGVKRKEIN
jgi:short subunit dehydrogenase-like uncharacterized protein